MKRVLGVLLGLACAASTARAQDNVFIANQNGNTVTVADAQTYAPLPTTASGGPNPVTVGTAPGATLHDPVHKLVYVINTTSADVTVIDPTLFKVTATIAMPGASNLQGAVLSQDGNFLFIAGFQTVPKKSGVFQLDLNNLTATGASFVAGIVIGSGALDCEVLPASSVGGAGNAPGRLYFSASNNLYEINMLSAPLTAVAVPLPTGTNPPIGFTRLARSPDSKFILTGSTSNTLAGSVWQVIRINPLASPEADFFNLVDISGAAGNVIDDVVFQGSAGPPFAVSLMVRDDASSRLRFLNVSSAGGPLAYTAGPNVPFQFGNEFTTDTAGQRLFIAWNGTTSSPNGYQVYDPAVSTVATQLQNSTGGAPVAFSFAPQPPRMAIESVTEPAGDTTTSFQLEIFGHGFIQNSSAAKIVNGAGVPFPATTTTVLSPGVILATFPTVATAIYDVNVTNNDGQTSTLKGFYQGLNPATAVITTDITNLPPLTSGYAMLSYPQYATVGDLRSAIAAQLGSYDPTLFRLFFWQQTGYVELNDPKLSPAQSIMGVGFFGLSRYGRSVSITAPDVSGNTPGTRVVAIGPGWNLIAQPYFFGVTQTIQYSNLLVSSTPDQAITQPANATTLLSNVVYELQGGVYVPVTALTAGKAYWILNNIASPVYLIYTRANVNKPGVPPSGPPAPLTPPAPPAGAPRPVPGLLERSQRGGLRPSRRRGPPGRPLPSRPPASYTGRVTPASTRRFRLRRAVERGDPRLGLVVGVLLAALSALAFVRRDWVGVAETLELKALDFAFKQRQPIRESEKILEVDIDDRTLRKLPWPIPREDYAGVTTALDRLGAAQIVFDVEFSTVIPRPGYFDEETGENRLKEGEAALPFAIGKSGKVMLAYHFDLKPPLAERLEPYVPALKKVFAANVGADLEEVVSRSGVPRDWVADDLESLRDVLVPALIGEELERQPSMSFADLRNKFLPNFDSQIHGSLLKLIQFGWQQWRSGRAMETKAPVARVVGLPPRPARAYLAIPPLYPFLEQARGVATANAEPDAQDGVMRRPWSHLQFHGKSYPYLGLQAGSQALAGAGGTADTVVHPDHVEVLARSAQGEERRAEIPVDGEGRILVNWAGNAGRNRGAETAYFTHVPFLEILKFYEARYLTLDANVRRTIKQANEDERQVLRADEYLKLSDRFNEALKGRGSLTFEKAREIEGRLDLLRKGMAETYRQVAANIDQALKTLTSPRARKASETERDHRIQIAREIEGPYEEEKRLRPVVEGKLCLIGSASTGSGDLYATPLGSSVPGMDVLANVANMVLTGQTIRRAPGWVNFVYLFAIGLLVSYFVTHGSATGSSIATAGTIAATGAVFWFLFTGPAILISGAGPVVTAILTFAGVTTYKELLTQRSKRKLQRELEKNTSPELVKIIMERPEVLSEPRRIMGTFFFSDVKSFTSISEKMHADVLFPFINRYLDRQTQALKAHQAFVDKYIGDGIMALFGIPVPTPDHAKNACAAALDCQAALKPLNAEFKLEGLPQIKARIGIHSGEVSAGNVGALDRSNYTVLGDNVNLAARLEGANKEYDTSIMISEATWALVEGKFVVRELDRIRVVGKKNAVRIFELIAPAGGELPFPREFLDAYAAALGAFKGRRWDDAIRGFEGALELKPGDAPSKTYVERAKVFQMMPPPDDWEGVFDLTSK